MNRKVKILIAVAAVIVLLVGGAIGYYAGEVSGAFRKEGSVTVVIPQGATGNSVAALLAEKGVIGNPLIFRFYLRGKNVNLQYGTFEINPKSDYDTIIRVIEEMQEATDVVDVTVPEGTRTVDVIASLVAAGIGSEDEITDVINNYPFEHSFIPKEGDYTGYRLEGYLFPDTYSIYQRTGEENIADAIKKMLDNFEEKTKDLYALCEQKGLNFRDVITLASIVQREGVKLEELPTIAQVFRNRLDQGMLLQSCATVQFFLPEHKKVLSYDDIAIDNPYNTYIYAGLTPGPIGNPGIDAIRATIEPDGSDYLYFVARYDSSHYFGRTYAEHEANIARSNAEEAAHSQG